MTKLIEFNPTSRQHIAWALQNFSQARFTKVTDTGKPKVDEASMSEMRDLALQQENNKLAEECDMFIRLLTLQKWLGQLSEGQTPGSTQLKMTVVFTTVVPWLPRPGVTRTVDPTWARW